MSGLISHTQQITQQRSLKVGKKKWKEMSYFSALFWNVSRSTRSVSRIFWKPHSEVTLSLHLVWQRLCGLESLHRGIRKFSETVEWLPFFVLALKQRRYALWSSQQCDMWVANSWLVHAFEFASLVVVEECETGRSRLASQMCVTSPLKKKKKKKSSLQRDAPFFFYQQLGLWDI